MKRKLRRGEKRWWFEVGDQVRLTAEATTAYPKLAGRGPARVVSERGGSGWQMVSVVFANDEGFSIPHTALEHV